MIRFWQVYRYAYFEFNGQTYRKLHNRYDAILGVVNAVTVGLTPNTFKYFQNFIMVTPLESQHTEFLQPTTSEKHLRQRN